jgi:hypothetical protein
VAKEKKKSSEKKPQTAILRCHGARCVSEYQDARYGPNMRVHNHQPGKKGYSCTVCELVKPD